MARIMVNARINGGTHVKYGPIIKGQQYEIDDIDFGPELFERPEGFVSPHEVDMGEQPVAPTGLPIPVELQQGEQPVAPTGLPIPVELPKQKGGK